MATDSTMTKPIIELIRPGAMGDLLMATALFPQLKAQGYQIRFVCHPKYAPALAHHPLIDELVTIKGGDEETMRAQTAHLPSAEKTVFLQYPFYAKRDLPQHAIPLHIAEHFCLSAGLSPSRELSLLLSDEDETFGKHYSDAVLIHPNSLWSPYKNWPKDRWAKLVEHIKNDFNLPIYQLGTEADEVVDGVIRLPSHTLQHVFGALKHCKLLIGQDSVFNHASKALNKPSIILWGSTHPQGMGYTENLNIINGVVWQAVFGNDGPTLKCQPCYREFSGPGNNNTKRTCPYTIAYPEYTLPLKMHPNPEITACMNAQSVSAIYTHVKASLEQGVSTYQYKLQQALHPVLTW